MGVKGNKKKITKEELAAMSNEKMNRFGQWFFSENKQTIVINDMRAVMK